MPKLRSTSLIALGALSSALVMILWVTQQAPEYELRGPLDLFDLATVAPIMFVLPLIASVTGASSVVSWISHRGASLWWTRTSAGHELWRRTVSAGLSIWVAHSLAVVGVFWWSTSILPGLGITHFDAAGYGLTTTDSITTDVASRANFGAIAAFGPWAFGLLWSALIGLQAACYCTLSIGIAVVSGRPILALFLPFIGFHVETIATALISEPRLGLMHLLAPFGLSPGPTVMPISVLATLVACALASVAIPAARPTAFRALQ